MARPWPLLSELLRRRLVGSPQSRDGREDVLGPRSGDVVRNNYQKREYKTRKRLSPNRSSSGRRVTGLHNGRTSFAAPRGASVDTGMNSTAGFSAGIGAFPPFAITPNFEDAESLQHHGLRDVTSLEDLARLGGGFTWPTTAPMSSAPVESRRIMPPDPPEAKVGAVSAATAGAQQPYDASPCWGFVMACKPCLLN